MVNIPKKQTGIAAADGDFPPAGDAETRKQVAYNRNDTRST